MKSFVWTCRNGLRVNDASERMPLDTRSTPGLMLHQFPKHLYRLNQTIHFDFESLKKRKPNSLVSSFGWMHHCSSGTRAAMLVCGHRMKSLPLLGGEWACASPSIAVSEHLLLFG
jgi:hypothetical protein